MKFALSTNWCNRRLATAEEIADAAEALGFDSLELGFSTTQEQADGFARLSGRIPVTSVHAFCPVPLSAPHGHPELYTLASLDPDERAIARFHVLATVRFAASVGANAIVHHAGRIPLSSFFHRGFGSPSLRAIMENHGNDASAPAYAKALARARKARAARSPAILDAFCGELDALVPELEKASAVLALENLPYLEGFPDEEETKKILARFDGAPVKAWFDTGHHRVRQMHGWVDSPEPPLECSAYAGMHLNDVTDFFDEHHQPGGGKVDFAALEGLARSVGHVVFEPKSHVSAEKLAEGVAFVRSLWADGKDGGR